MSDDTQWHIAQNGQQEGPMTADDVLGRIRLGKLGRDDHVFGAGMDDWVKAGDHPTFAGAFGASAPPSSGSRLPRRIRAA